MTSPASTPVKATRVSELRKKFDQRRTVFSTPEEMPTSPYFNRKIHGADPLGVRSLNLPMPEADFGAHKLHAEDPGPEVFESVGTCPVPELAMPQRLSGDLEREQERKRDLGCSNYSGPSTPSTPSASWAKASAHVGTPTPASSSPPLWDWDEECGRWSASESDCGSVHDDQHDGDDDRVGQNRGVGGASGAHPEGRGAYDSAAECSCNNVPGSSDRESDDEDDDDDDDFRDADGGNTASSSVGAGPVPDACSRICGTERGAVAASAASEMQNVSTGNAGQDRASDTTAAAQSASKTVVLTGETPTSPVRQAMRLQQKGLITHTQLLHVSEADRLHRAIYPCADSPRVAASAGLSVSARVAGHLIVVRATEECTWGWILSRILAVAMQDDSGCPPMSATALELDGKTLDLGAEVELNGRPAHVEVQVRTEEPYVV